MTKGKVLLPREAGKFIASKSTHVKIEYANVVKAAEAIYERMRNQVYTPKHWKEHDQHPKEMNKHTVDWIFVVDCLNFSFWVPSNISDFTVSYHGKMYTDYVALCAVINRAVEEGFPLTSPSFYKDLSLEDARYIFRSATKTEIPLLEERVQCLRTCGKVLVDEYDGSFANVILKSCCSAQRLVSIIVGDFPPFRDEAVFEGMRLALYKRAQILVADIWACFEGVSFGQFHDIDSITMFADYRVPVSLLSLGVLSYSAELVSLVEREALLPYGCRMEVEIRGCSIEAVELLKKEILIFISKEEAKQITLDKVNAILIDFYLWDYATDNPGLLKRFREHRTRSIFY